MRRSNMPRIHLISSTDSWLKHAVLHGYDNHDIVKQSHAGYVIHIQSRNGIVCTNQTFALATKVGPKTGWLMLYQDCA